MIYQTATIPTNQSSTLPNVTPAIAPVPRAYTNRPAHLNLGGGHSFRLMLLLAVLFFSAQEAMAATLTVNVKNVSGSIPSSGVRIVVYDSSYNVVATKSGSGTQSFSVLSGTYNVEGYFTGTFLGEEFWASDTLPVSSSGATLNLMRNYPYATDIRVYNGSTDVTGTTVTAGTALQVKVSVKNSFSFAETAQVRLILDRDQVTAYDFDNTSSATTLSANSTTVFTFNYTPAVSGTFYAAMELKTQISAMVRTDSWIWTSCFTSSSPTPPTVQFSAASSIMSTSVARATGYRNTCYVSR